MWVEKSKIAQFKAAVKEDRLLDRVPGTAALLQIREEMEALRQAGYSVEDIVEVIKEELNFEPSTSSVNSILKAPKKTAQPAPPKKRTKAKEPIAEVQE